MSKPFWEDYCEKIDRLKVDGSYLYTFYGVNDNSICFVPDIPDNEAIYNKAAELSMKINMMQSSLREFEKQKVDPLVDRINELEAEKLTNEIFRKSIDDVFNGQQNSLHDLEKCFITFKQDNDGLIDKIGELEKSIEYHRKNHATIYDYIKKLEEADKSLRSYISDCDKARFDADQNIIDSVNELKNEVKGINARLKHPLLGNAEDILKQAIPCNHEWDLKDFSTYPAIWKCSYCGIEKRQGPDYSLNNPRIIG